MTNKERQASLDKDKWKRSEEFGKDMSGKMTYCEKCDAEILSNCTATQEERESQCLCAKAFNRMVRVKR